MRLLIASLFLGSLMFFAFSNNDTSTAIAKDATTHVQIASVDVLTFDEVALVEGTYAKTVCSTEVNSGFAKDSCYSKNKALLSATMSESVINKYMVI